jgi:hypothetical protein
LDVKEVDEPTGTVGAAYAYAYQSGNIHMQGYGGQFVSIDSYPTICRPPKNKT